MAKSFHHLKTHTHDEADGQQIEMIAHPGGGGDHVRLAASQCCGGSERVWRGGMAQGTSTTAQWPAPSRPRPCRSSRLWRGGRRCRRSGALVCSAQRRKRCCSQPARACGPAPAGKEQNVGAKPAFLQRSYEQQPIRFTRVRA